MYVYIHAYTHTHIHTKTHTNTHTHTHSLSLSLSHTHSLSLSHTGTCDVAEITLNALEKLMTIRPHLQRELQDIAHQRDVSNVVTGIGAKKTSNKLSEMLKSKDQANNGARRGRATPADTAADNGGALVRFPRPCRVLTRTSKTIRQV